MDTTEKAPEQEERHEAAPAEGAGAQGAQPGEGEALQRLVVAAMKLIYQNPETAQKIAQALGAEQDKAAAIANITMPIVEQLRASMAGMNPDIAYAVAPMVAVMVAEIGVKSGAVPDDPKVLAGALGMLKRQIAGKAGAPQQAQAGAAPQAAAQPGAAPADGGIVSQAMGG